MYAVEASIEGLCPILQHNPGDLTNSFREGMDIHEFAKKTLYLTRSGKVYQPATHIKAGLIKVATNFQIQGKGHKTYKDAVKALVLVEPSEIIHKYQKWVPDVRFGVLPATRGRVKIVRARLDKWALDFKITVLEDDIQPQKLREMLEYMGKYNGLGDYRPELGRFLVSHFRTEK